MGNDVEVSVIVLSYNQDLEKLRKSIKSTIMQKNINFEVIVSDDGSVEDPSSMVKSLFKENKFINYKILRNKKNVGTVKNILGALKVAKGEYIAFVSSGDFLYDDFTLAEFYKFAKEKNAKICFGNYLKYSFQNSELKIYNDGYAPRSPQRYTRNLLSSKVTFFLIEDNICGISYFREKKFFVECLECVSKYSIYVEDTTTTAYALMKNEPIYYFDRNIAWYEYGSGISTSYNPEDNRKITADFNKFYEYLYLQYSKDPVLTVKRKQYIRMKFLLRFPLIALDKNIMNKYPTRKATYPKDYIETLNRLLEIR